MKHDKLSIVLKLHTTPMGLDRIKKNLNIKKDPVEFCKNIILTQNCKISRHGKNFYAEDEDIVITINSQTFSIITAHKKGIK